MSDFYNKYPYTDFHELNLDWVIERVKKLTEDWAATLEEWNSTEEQWQELYNYVHDYFDNLNVQQEINNKINAMILDGTFQQIATPIIQAKVAVDLPGVVSDQIGGTVAGQIGSVVAGQLPDVVSDQIGSAVVNPVNTWLAANITQPTTPVVDTSLSISGAAADAAVTGNIIGALIDNMDDVSEDTQEDITDILDAETGFYSRNSYVINPTATSYKTYTVKCFPGEQYALKGVNEGGGYDDAYAIIRYLNGSGLLISDVGSVAGVSSIDTTVTIPDGCFSFTFTNSLKQLRPYIQQLKFRNSKIAFNLARTSNIIENTVPGHIEIDHEETGFYHPGDVDLTSAATTYRTDFYRVYGGETVYVKTEANGGLYDGTLDLIRFYDYDGNCFTSGIYTSIAGNNVIDTTYIIPHWASYIAVSRNDVSYIEVIRKPNVAIFIGDSYVQASSLATAGLDQSKRFSTVISKKYGLIERNYAVGGMGFYVGSPTFEEQLNTAIADTSYDHDSVKYIFICGGRNDQASIVVDGVDVTPLVKSVIQKAHTNYPNAKIIMVPYLWDSVICNQGVYRSYRMILNACSSENCTVIPNAYSWLIGMKDCILSDNVHPNIEGHAIIADHITDALETGYFYPYTNSRTLSPVSDKISTDPSELSYVYLLNKDGKILFNAKIYITAQTGIWEELFSYIGTDQNDPVLISNYGHDIMMFNTTTRETRLIAISNSYAGGVYSIKANASGAALTPGLWIAYPNEIVYGFEEFAYVE